MHDGQKEQLIGASAACGTDATGVPPSEEEGEGEGERVRVRLGSFLLLQQEQIRFSPSLRLSPFDGDGDARYAVSRADRSVGHISLHRRE